MEDRLEEAMRDLNRSISKIRSLFEWQKLKYAETKIGTPPSFQFHEDIEGEIKAEQGFFLYMAQIIREHLKEANDEKLRTLKTRLENLEKQFRLLFVAKAL